MKKIKNGQNLIEFIFVTPVLIFILLAIVELAMYWRSIHTVQGIALQAGANAATQIVTDDQTSLNVYDSDCTDLNGCMNFAVAKAVNVLEHKQGALSYSGMTFSCTNPSGYGTRPYAIYECVSTGADGTKNVNGTDLPVMKLSVDYRNPMENGVVVQLTYQYTTLFVGHPFKVHDEGITVMSRDVEISSTKIQQYIHY